MANWLVLLAQSELSQDIKYGANNAANVSIEQELWATRYLTQKYESLSLGASHREVNLYLINRSIGVNK